MASAVPYCLVACPGGRQGIVGILAPYNRGQLSPERRSPFWEYQPGLSPASLPQQDRENKFKSTQAHTPVTLTPRREILAFIEACKDKEKLSLSWSWVLSSSQSHNCYTAGKC